MGYASEDVENLAKHTFNLKQKDREKFFLGFGELVPNMAERKTGGKFFDRIFSPKSIVKKYHELESKGLLMSRDEGEANKTLSDKNWKNPFDGD